MSSPAETALEIRAASPGDAAALHAIDRPYRRRDAGITLPNPASVALHRALGFQPIGVFPAVGRKFGRWHDVAWWHRPLRPSEEAPPVEPDATASPGGAPERKDTP